MQKVRDFRTIILLYYFIELDMDSELTKNFERKINHSIELILQSLDEEFESMLRTHSSKGLLRSGNTISSAMDLAGKLLEKYFVQAIEHINYLQFSYSDNLETDISKLVHNASEPLKEQLLVKFRKSTEVAGKPNLYERLLPELNQSFQQIQSAFEISLNSNVLLLKAAQKRSTLEKGLWLLELTILLCLFFIGGMWFNDPNGNYEPLFVTLLLVMPTIGLIINKVRK